MKKILALILALALMVTPALAAGGGTGAAVYENETALSAGLTYQNVISYNASGRRVETFTLENAPQSSVYPIVLACDTIYGGMTVSGMISYAKSLGYGVVGAVNADFGYWDTRIPCGMVVEDGVYKSSPEGNNALAFGTEGAFASFMPEVNITLENTTSGGSLSLTHLNKSRAEGGGLYLYSEHFSTVSTRTSGEGWFVRLKVLEGSLSLSGAMSLEVTELITDKESVPIGEGYLVLTAAEADGLSDARDSLKPGDKVTLTTSCTDEKLAGARWVSGCGNVLIQDGAVFRPEWWDESVAAANPRTAVGIKADGTVVYHVMDGRTTASKGATLAELSADMLSMGCVTAVNMDGGGSSVMSLKMPGTDGYKVVNSPSDGSLRSVCSYILFVTDLVPSGKAENLYIKQDGAFILSGSSLELGYLATDNAMNTVAAPGGTSVAAALGSISGGVYTAPQAAGEDRLALSAPGASGSGTLHVISAADSLTVKNAATGKDISSAQLEQGESLALSVSAKYLLRDVFMDASAVKYSVSGGVGSVTEAGEFTAAGEPGAEGKLTVTAAGLSRDIAIKLDFEFEDMKGHWAAEYVKSLYDAGTVSGTSAKTFSPDDGMKRCDFALMLYNAAGKPAVTGAGSFADVAADAYYASAVAWAEQNGIARGDGSGKFDPEGVLTREQGFTFVYRALGALGVTYTEGDAAVLEPFADASALADWSRQAAATLISMGVVQGSGGALSPAESLTRAQMAKLLCVTLYRA